MKKIYNFTAILFAIIFALFCTDANGQLLVNEIEFDPPSNQSDGCQYVEIRGAAGATVPANTWFVTIDNSNANPGNIAFATNIGGTVFGANGTITILNSGVGTCPGRNYGPGTTTVTIINPLGLGFAMSRAFLLLTTTTALTPGQNVDSNQDGQFDFPVTVMDGFAFNINPKEEFNYGGSPQIYAPTTGGLDVPDAVTRFSNNTTPLSGAAFYYGELAASPDETTAYAAPLSPNFPSGGALTPGTPNVPVLVASDAIVDFDGDGRTDFSVVRLSGNNAIWYNSLNGSGTFSGLQWGQPGDVPVVEDYDGDGKDDVAVWRPAGAATFYILQSSSSTVRIANFGQTADDPALVGDWDGDGHADPAVYRNAPAGQQSFFYYLGSSNNPANNITYVPWGLGNDQGVRGDFDGDDKQDPAVFRPSDNSWWIRQSSNAQLLVIPFGLASDVKVSGDFDGDHKTDQAVYRGGVWWIRESGNGQVRLVNWGLAGDTPVPGDYDGDGSADFAVWRSGVYYVQSAGTGNITYFPWGLPSDQPVASVFNN